MYDVVIAGAGPAGSVAAIVLARAGARVALIDRAPFPRHKLCGDTLNPGVLGILQRLKLSSMVEACGLPIAGMILTGEGGEAVQGRYPNGLVARSIKRSDFDWALVQDAVASGANFFDETTVLEPIVETEGPQASVRGVWVRSRDIKRAIRGKATIAADGRRSRIAFTLGLSRHPVRPRRWAVGVYAERVDGTSDLGEMHIRRGRYIGVAPLPNGVTNVCLVKPSSGSDPDLADPLGAVRAALATDRVLRERFARARFVTPPTVIGPLAIDATNAPVPDGLLLAGDAAGFIDPMTGDGLRFAIRGGELAAEAALRALADGWTGLHDRVTELRRQEFQSKYRFNRALRSVVGSRVAVRAATAGAFVLQPLLRSLIFRAGDCDLCEHPD
ncbi:MAG TPA: FAD-dependent monooxygenase [Vicinamibacterales bacterium]